MRNRKKLYCVLLLVFLGSLSINQALFGQIRAGASFLKELPGARVKSMALSQTSEIDDAHAIFSNPGAAGFLREWHWAATYSTWIADVYYASFILNKRIRNPISNQTRFSVGVLYQGVPDFDSSDKVTPNASANDFLFALSIGQPLTVLSDNISFGANLKYFKSTLDTYNASAFVTDVGLLARTPKFRLGNPLFNYGILTAGVALTQLGSDLKFDRAGTPLPKTLRTGVSFYAGTHSGVQLQLSTDYYEIKDEPGVFGVGAEFSFGNLLSINCGYKFKSDLMDKFSVGGAIRLDDIRTSQRSVLPGRNNGLKLALATVGEGEFFSRTYRGEVNHLPVGPEYFEFIYPANGDTVIEKNITFNWEKSRDPDLFDDVKYTLLVERDSLKLENLVTSYDKFSGEFYTNLNNADSIYYVAVNCILDTVKVPVSGSGDYYWTVIATDKNQHHRFIEKNNSHVSRFFIPTPDVEIRDIQFEYSPWITTDDYHGDLLVEVANIGTRVAEDFTIVLSDSTLPSFQIAVNGDKEKKNRQLIKQKVEELKPSQTTVIRVPWNTSYLGAHKLSAIADFENVLEESNEANNTTRRIFYTIPKGTFLTDDQVTILENAQQTIDIPMVTEVYFDPELSKVRPEFIYKTNFEPYLRLLATRLKANPGTQVSLQGFADPNSENSSISLANDRAQAVRDTLIQLGAGAAQIKLLPGEVFKRRRVPANPQDAAWVFEERRCVKIFAESADEEILFQPIRQTYNEEEVVPVAFDSKIKTALPITDVYFTCSKSTTRDSINIKHSVKAKNIIGEYNWEINEQKLQSWLNINVGYQFMLKDSLGRDFKTREKETETQEKLFHKGHRIVLPMQFAKTEPIYKFYWDLVIKQAKEILDNPNWHFKLTGHACAVGPSGVNARLSNQRVKRFDSSFRIFLKKNNPEVYKQIVTRLNRPKGFGENEPLAIKFSGAEKLIIGDNMNPIGRKLNRRIEVEFYNLGKR